MPIPFGLAAGFIKSANQLPPGLIGVASHITFGSFTLEAWEGQVHEPTYWYDPESGMSINAVGLRNQGLDEFLGKDLPTIVRLMDHVEPCIRARIRVSLATLTAEDIETMCTKIMRSPLVAYIDELEINTACPNHRSGGILHPVLVHDDMALKSTMARTCIFTGKKAVKIAPHMTPKALHAVMRLCVAFGFDAIVSANTWQHSSVIKGAERLSVNTGGIAGSPLLKIGLRQIRLLNAIRNETGANVKLRASGGIMAASHLTDYEICGADEAMLGTAYAEYGPKIFQDFLVALHT